MTGFLTFQRVSKPATTARKAAAKAPKAESRKSETRKDDKVARLISIGTPVDKYGETTYINEWYTEADQWNI